MSSKEEYIAGMHERMHERVVELAAMFKEKSQGDWHSMKKILAKFSIQEGVQMRTAYTYLENLKSSCLITVFRGRKGWKYNPDEEWDLFTVPIDNRTTS